MANQVARYGGGGGGGGHHGHLSKTLSSRMLWIDRKADFLSTDLYSRLYSLVSGTLFSWGAVPLDTIMASSLMLTTNKPDHVFHEIARKRRRMITPLMIIRPVRLSE